MTMHTPGEWSIGQYDWSIVDENDSEIAQANCNDSNWRQNAHLIAAAPKLLQALKVIIDRIGPKKDLTLLSYDIRNIAENAIAKAEGKS
jgi:hypothetical protein